MKKIKFFNIPIDSMSMNETLEKIKNAIVLKNKFITLLLMQVKLY